MNQLEKITEQFAKVCQPSTKVQPIFSQKLTTKQMYKQVILLYKNLSHISFDVEKRSDLYKIFRELFEELILCQNSMKTNELIRYINYEILRTNNDLFNILK